MINKEQDHELLRAQGDHHLIPSTPGSDSSEDAAAPRRRMGIGQKIFVVLLLTVVLVPSSAAFYSFFMGIPLRVLASTKGTDQGENEARAASTRSEVTLVPGQAHTLEVPAEVCVSLGIHKGGRDAVAIAQKPTTMRPLVLPGSTALDPTRLARIRARFAPARVVELGQIWDRSHTHGHTEFRELRQGDHVAKGDLLGVFYSVDVGSKKNDLLDALVQLELDQKILDRVEANRYSVPEVYYLTQVRAVQGDRNAINRALNNLRLWDIPQEEIDELHAEAKKIASNKSDWYKTPEGLWVKGEKPAKDAKGEKHAESGKGDSGKEKENPWGRVTLRAPFDGVIVERNVHVDEMVVDNTVNLLQIADVNRLLVIASCPEDQMPALEALDRDERKWTIRTVGTATDEGLSGFIDEIGYVIDPNQHTAVIKGYVDNPGRRIRAGQYVTATVQIPPPDDAVEIPTDALVDDGKQCLVFVQPDPGVAHFTMRRVQVTHRFDKTVLVRTTPIPIDEQLTAQEKDEGLLPKEPLRPGERVLVAGAVELKAVVLDLESRSEKKKPKTAKS
jgi:cobalt-zinc-cadmium efflux system membrane fusion protein